MLYFYFRSIRTVPIFDAWFVDFMLEKCAIDSNWMWFIWHLVVPVQFSRNESLAFLFGYVRYFHLHDFWIFQLLKQSFFLLHSNILKNHFCTVKFKFLIRSVNKLIFKILFKFHKCISIYITWRSIEVLVSLLHVFLCNCHASETYIFKRKGATAGIEE